MKPPRRLHPATAIMGGFAVVSVYTVAVLLFLQHCPWVP